MEAGKNGTTRVRYTECDWGDLIEGTKEQLQALGLGLGLAFPGEPGAPRIELKVRDPRGYQAVISNRYHHDECFTVYLSFPDWPERPDMLGTMAPAPQGLQKRECALFDEYIGSADDLAAAGLVRLDQLPGQPGMRKVRVTIFPDGSLPTGPHTANHREAKSPGARSIERASRSTFRVTIQVTPEVETRRRAVADAAARAWVQEVRARPRPARLQPMAPSKWARIEADRANAARDVAFQGMLARIVSGANKQPGGSSPS